MFSKLGTKIALHKAGLGNVSLPSFPKSEGNYTGGKNKNGEESEGGGGVSNPFANVQWGKAFSSWQTPPAPPNPVAEPPAVGGRASSNVKLKFPAIDGRPCVVLFMRYCGCPCKQSFLFLLATMRRAISPQKHFNTISTSQAPRHYNQTTANQFAQSQRNSSSK